MSHQWLKTLNPHAGIEKLTGKSMSQRMQGIPLMRETGFCEIPFKDKIGGTIRHISPALGVKKKLVINISHLKPCLQGDDRIITELNHSPYPVLLAFVNINPAILEVKILHLCAKQFADSHPRP
jgi:hypothetical protein